MLQCLRVDRGAIEEGVGRADALPRARLAFLARGARLGVGAPQATFWLVVRGSARVQAREGRFLLRAGEWLAFGRDAEPLLAADRR
ncbi:MAG TPA: AraC family transcriptional regulator, partial [Xanthomonadaceae bacterium]|nr:AraC family transcriptional regulator [Xanthomonadaceae bacterium]